VDLQGLQDHQGPRDSRVNRASKVFQGWTETWAYLGPLESRGPEGRVGQPESRGQRDRGESLVRAALQGQPDLSGPPEAQGLEEIWVHPVTKDLKVNKDLVENQDLPDPQVHWVRWDQVALEEN